MALSLLISVRIHDGRYHGTGDWPPSPWRLFQALLASSTGGGKLTQKEDRKSLEWLEKLDAPIIAVPPARPGQACKVYVPDNDLDKKGGDPSRIAEIRTSVKKTNPRIFNQATPLLYIWGFDGNSAEKVLAETICRISERLYQFGRGVDMAWAWGEILETDEVENRLICYEGAVYRPGGKDVGTVLRCPRKGSLANLITSYERPRFKNEGGRKVFSQASKPGFAKIAYRASTARHLYEIRSATSDTVFVPWPFDRISDLVVTLRDKAVKKLKDALKEKSPDQSEKIERVFVGRESTEADKTSRIRILPLPSIGHVHADQSIRRVLVEIPPNCLLRPDDIAWAFSGIEEVDAETGEILWNLVPTNERGMLEHYDIDDNEQQQPRVWRTVTPMAFPVKYGQRGSKPATKRRTDEKRMRTDVLHALRHVSVSAKVQSIHVQREPFCQNGSRAEDFSKPERFPAFALRHVEIVFAEGVSGPLVVGNGRYLGLGLMAPQKGTSQSLCVLPIMSDVGIAMSDAKLLLSAVRRALMALSRNEDGRVPKLFSGHEQDRGPARSGIHEHVFLAANDTDNDGYINRLIIVAPWVCDRTTKGTPSDHSCFDRVSRLLTHVQAGKLGILRLEPPLVLESGDPLVGPSRIWESRTCYRPTRHAGRRKVPETELQQDLFVECERRGLPIPEVDILKFSVGPNGGNLTADLRLRFAVALEGPIMLGRDSHEGGGLFVASK